jgi:hypothetical protein
MIHRAYIREDFEHPWRFLCQTNGDKDDCWTLARSLFEALALKGRFAVQFASLVVLEWPLEPYGPLVKRRGK